MVFTWKISELLVDLDFHGFLHDAGELETRIHWPVENS